MLFKNFWRSKPPEEDSNQHGAGESAASSGDAGAAEKEPKAMNRFTMSNLAMLMSFKVSAKEIEKIIEKLEIYPSDNLVITSEESVNIAMVQLMRRRYASLIDYVIDMNLYVSDAVNRRAQLVCFPAYTGVLPATFLPQFDNSIQKIQPQKETGLPDMEELNNCLAYFSDVMFEAYYQTMSQLAAKHQVYIMAGTALYFEESTLRHRAFLFGPDGELAGRQGKISLNAVERELQLTPASEVHLFETSIGPLSILIGEDVDYYETARVAKNLGAKIILNPTLFLREQTPVDTSLGLNLRVQENHIYGVQSVLVGDSDIGVTLEGPASAFAPVGLIKNQNGILIQTNGHLQPDIVLARLDLTRLPEASNTYTKDINPELMLRHVDRLY